MPSDEFSRSLRALESTDGARTAVIAAALISILAAWTGWLFWARVSVYVVGEQTRIEVNRAAFRVDAPVAGRILSSSVQLGAEVDKGTVLVALDARDIELELAEERKEEAALEAQLKALREVIEAEARTHLEIEGRGKASRAETQARSEEAQAAAALALREAERFESLREVGALPLSQIERARAEAEQRRLSAEAVRGTSARLEWESRAAESEHRAREKMLRLRERRIEGELEVHRAAIARLEHEVDKRSIRAPIAGRIGDAPALHEGAHIDAGFMVAAVVPEGELRIVAYLPARNALGRVREGQEARLQLDAFSWIEYGSIPARVAAVGAESRQGTIRVELAIDGATASSLPLQHGLSGSLEIEVERISPAELLLRKTGRMLRPSESAETG
jgi:membrane fusion protein (multidrug efflux system)